MWATKLKLAIVAKDTDSVEALLESIPKFDTLDDAQEVLFLLREATILVHTLQDETAVSMKRVKKNIDFIKSNQVKPANTLNLVS